MIQIDRELKDIVISALRYVIGRKTYVTDETCDYIKSHPELIDKRIKKVMLKDLEKINDIYNDDEFDYHTFKIFAEWLKDLEVE